MNSAEGKDASDRLRGVAGFGAFAVLTRAPQDEGATESSATMAQAMNEFRV